MHSYRFFILFFSIGISCLILACQSSSATKPDSKSEVVCSTPDAHPLESAYVDIRFEIRGYDSGIAYLIGFFAENNFKIDSSDIVPEGIINFKRDTLYPEGYYYLYLPDQKVLPIMLGSDQKFSIRADIDDLQGSARVDGNIECELLFHNLQFEARQDPLFKSLEAKMKGMDQNSSGYKDLEKQAEKLVVIRKEHLDSIFTNYPGTLFTAFKRAGQNPDIKKVYDAKGKLDLNKQLVLYREEFWNGVDFDDDRLLHTPVIFNKLRRYIKELTPQQTDSIIKSASILIDQVLDYPAYFKFFANWIAINYESTKTTVMDPEAIFVHLVDNYFTNERAFWADSAEIYALQLRAHEMKASLIGREGPEVEAPDLNAQLQSTRQIKSPYLIIYLFNPDCEHCIEQTPKLVEFYRDWKNKGVEIYAIGVDTNDSDWRGYVTKNELPWINVFDPTYKAIYAKYYVDITPELYLLNPQRKIIAKNLKVSQVAEVIERDKKGKG